jgi:glycosyltransferase involved in cell wall biosynthesis
MPTQPWWKYMDGQDKGRVALFQSNWIVSSQTANAVIALAAAGYRVELFLFNSPQSQDYVDLEELGKRTNAEIHRLWTAEATTTEPATTRPTNGQPTIRRRLRSFLRGRFPAVIHAQSFLRNAYQLQALRRGLAEGLLMPGQVERALEVMAGKQYRCLIGVEKKGLVWAGLVARRLGVPYFYHSLELYTDDGDYWRILTPDRFEFRRLRLGERLHHRHAAATIIQDRDRARVLFQANGLDMSRATILYVPVSVLGSPHPRRGRDLQELLGIPSDRRMILYFGHIWERRYALELVDAAQRFPDDWLLVMHGPAADSTVAKIKELDRRHKVVLSLNMLPFEHIQDIIASADAGLLFYSGESHNERLTAFASEKMALYMQCGVPFVAFDYPGFRRLADEDRCGVVIRQLEDLPDAVGTILMNRAEFSQNAHLAFEKHYNFTKDFAKVLEAIERL